MVQDSATSFTYNSTCASTGHVGGEGAYLAVESANQYFLSGVLAALDAPGEWHYDELSRALSVIMPDGGPPGTRVGVKVKEYCVDLEMESMVTSGHDHVRAGRAVRSAPVTVANLSLVGCTFRLRNCEGCTLDYISIIFFLYLLSFFSLMIDVSVSLICVNIIMRRHSIGR